MGLLPSVRFCRKEKERLTSTSSKPLPLFVPKPVSGGLARAALGISLALLGSTGLRGQKSSPAWDDPTVRSALEIAEKIEPRTIETQVRLCEIPAPPFKEEERAAAYADLFREMGLEEVRIDEEGNVLAEMKGASVHPKVVLSAHLDTVFPEGTDVTVQRGEGTLEGPGIVDDCRGLAVVHAVARAIAEAEVSLRGTLVFVGTVGEEGEGNLRGVRHLFQKRPLGEIDAFISIDGAGYGLTHGAVGSERYRVIFKGPGGHSYGAFGLPSPIHAMGRAIARIADFKVPSEPKTTFNVGVVEGGTSVNSIAFESSMSVDMRSIDPGSLADLVARFKKAIRKAVNEENQRWKHPSEKVGAEIQTIGIRPAGSLPVDSEIVQLALAGARQLGFESRLGSASTDANIPISLGIPAITIDGGGKGRGAHSPQKEIFETRDAYLGTQWALLLSLGLTGVISDEVHQ